MMHATAATPQQQSATSAFSYNLANLSTLHAAINNVAPTTMAATMATTTTTSHTVHASLRSAATEQTTNTAAAAAVAAAATAAAAAAAATASTIKIEQFDVSPAASTLRTIGAGGSRGCSRSPSGSSTASSSAVSGVGYIVIDGNAPLPPDLQTKVWCPPSSINPNQHQRTPRRHDKELRQKRTHYCTAPGESKASNLVLILRFLQSRSAPNLKSTSFLLLCLRSKRARMRKTISKAHDHLFSRSAR